MRKLSGEDDSNKINLIPVHDCRIAISLEYIMYFQLTTKIVSLNLKTEK